MRTRTFVLCLLAGCFAFALNAPKTLSQAVYGSILGTVTDQQGAAVAGAKITVTSVTKGTSVDTTSNESGNYTVTHLIPDIYDVKVEAQGFKTYQVKGIQVFVDTGATVDAKLQLGAVTQSIEVTGEIPQLKTDRADVSMIFNTRYVEDLPILNNNFTNFLLLSPGTQKLVGWSHAATENPQGSQQTFVQGQHFSGTAYELDGTDNQDPILGIIVVNPNLDAIEEAKFTLQDYDAEFGKSVAGVVTVQTKSGTNSLHGSGFFDYRSDGQQARNPFNNPPGVPLPHASFKQFGATAGGPIIKDKLFFFGDYQGTRQTNGLTSTLQVPTKLVKQTCTGGTTGNCDLSEYLGAPGINQGGQIYQPGTFVASANPASPCFDTPANRANALATGSCRAPFVGNLIPNSMISPQAAKILAAFPDPTSSGVLNNFTANGSGPYNQNSMDVRIDYNAPHDYKVFGRFSLDYFSLSGTGSLGVLGGPGFGPAGLNGQSRVHNYSLAAGFDKAIGTTLLTDFRFGWFKYNPQTAYSDAGSTPMDKFGVRCLNTSSSTCAGIPGPPTTGGLASFFFAGNGLSNGTAANAAGANQGAFGDGLNVGRCNCPLTESEQQFQFVNNWTKIMGNHTIKFGADIRYAMNLRVPSDANRTGILNFNSGDTANGGTGGLDLATFLLGDVTSFNRFVSTSLTAAERQRRWFFYGEDSWRVTPKFTFNYGLRWEIYFPETVNGKANGGFANLDQGVIRVAGVGNNNLHGNVANTLKAFAPRLGIAYAMNPKTVVRIGYGRSFDIGVFGSNFGHVVTQNLPVLANQDIHDSSLSGQSNFTNDRSAVFTLSQGPPSLTPITIPADGILPLRGPQNAVDPRVRPTVQRLITSDAWNATIQRQLTPTMNVTVSYLGSKGTHVFAGLGPAYNANEVAVGGGTDIGGKGFSAFTPSANRRRLFLNGVPAFIYPNFLDSSGKPLTCCSVDVGNYFGNDASSHYNALEIKVEKRFSEGLQFLAHYTYSRAFAYDSSYFSVDPRVAFGPDQMNRDHVFVVSSVYALPIGKGKRYFNDVGRAADFLVGGWQVSNTLTWAGGLPWTPSIGECGHISDAGPCRPNLVPGQSLSVGPRKINGQWVEFVPVNALSYGTVPAGTDACTLARPTSGPFALPACGHIGNAGFDSFRGPRAFFDDMSLSKDFTVTERVKAQFRFDAYNVFNHPVLGFNSNQGNTCVDCAGAGQITSIEADASPNAPNGMRQLQFNFRVTF